MSEPTSVHNSTVTAAETDHEQDLVVDLLSGTPQISEQLHVSQSLAAESDNASAHLVADSFTHSTEIDLDHQQHHWQQEHNSLVAELMQMRSLAHEQVERIQHLERALDQSLTSFNELRLQVIDQQFLETQLASTEEISNIQQQAITHLKQQLAQQQATLDLNLNEAKVREEAFQELLTTLELLLQDHQVELDRLRSQLKQDRTGIQTHQSDLEHRLTELQSFVTPQQQRIVELESQSLSDRVLIANLEVQLAQAQSQIKELSQNLDEKQTALEQLETELWQAHAALQEQQAFIDQLQMSRPLEPGFGTLTNSPDSVSTATKAEEPEVTKQLTAQAMLQHAYQELEAERDRQQTRLAELESQTADMQEQILKQAQQASEYETAVQHWKDRYVNSRDLALSLKAWIDKALPNPPVELVELLKALPNPPVEPIEPESQITPVAPAHRPLKVDLPEFLIRRRDSKKTDRK